MFGLDPPALDVDGGQSGSDPGSNAGSASDAATAAAIEFVQYGCNANWNPATSVATAFPNAQHASNLSLAVVSWVNPGSIATVSDSAGNTWAPIATPVSAGGLTQALYYSSAIRAGSNTLTVVFKASVAKNWLTVVEYSGLAQTNVVDTTAAQTGSSNSVSSGTVATSHPHDLIVGAATFTAGSDISSVGGGFAQRVRCYGDLVQDQVVTTQSSYAATATLPQSTGWTMRMVALRGAQ